MSWPSSDAVTSCSRSSSASVRPLPLLPMSSSHSGAVSSSSGAVSRRNRCSSAGRPLSTLSARKSQSGPRRRPTCGIAARRSAAGSRFVARLNSWRAAIHPPVRRSSSATSSGSSGRWYWSRNSRSTSQERNRRSSGPISSIRRPSRSREVLNEGRWRDSVTRWVDGGRSSITAATARSLLVPMTASNSSMTTSNRASPASSPTSTASMSVPVTGRRVARAMASPRWAASVASSPSIAWARYHTPSPPLRATRWPAAVVLPAPAGPTTIVSGTSQARSKRRSTRSRVIAGTAGGSNRARGSGRTPIGRRQISPLVGDAGRPNLRRNLRRWTGRRAGTRSNVDGSSEGVVWTRS